MQSSQNYKLHKLTFFLAVFAFLSAFSTAHAEVLVAADESNLISFYGVPLSPLQGEQVSWAISFVENFSLTTRPLYAKYSVVELSSEKVLAQTDFESVKSGVSSYSHLFEKHGIYELRVSYYYDGAPQKIYSVDLQVQVREKPVAETNLPLIGGIFAVGLLVGGATAFLVKKRNAQN